MTSAERIRRSVQLVDTPGLLAADRPRSRSVSFGLVRSQVDSVTRRLRAHPEEKKKKPGIRYRL